ncbi:D-xylose ABC transporter substrate-binding protein [Devosia sp. 2618]|uniref:D-xylose ABC transporter substrate-binding protein n=1 Tax=Devosia sp. 2618 TaxID=3156454 RepID=UPI0033936C6D
MNKVVTILLWSTAASALSGAAIAQDRIIVGISWNNFQEERWKTDELAIKSVLNAAGASYISADAQSSATKQLTDIESLIAQGADAIIVLAQDGDAIGPAVAAAVAEGIPVVGYDRLIENPDAFYLTFDNKEVGRLQAQGVFAVQPTGNYVFIKGNSSDANADFLFEGQMEVLEAAIESGDIINVGEAYTDNWNPEVAQANMEQFLTANNNEIDAVVASNDGTAGGAISALAAQGLAGSVPVSGQDGDHAALNRIALGTQTISVWKDARELGRKAAEVALELANGTPLNAVTGVVPFSGGPKGIEMNAFFIAPIPITRDNLNIVIDGGWVSKEVVCQGVRIGSVAACN